MSFMLKDQFMRRIGFDDSRGAGYFTKGYHKGGWGIDDRAFFEQSLQVLEDKEKSGPWMAALMTVGTHHPLVVPGRFATKEGEDKYSRAARYTDLYLDRLLTAMDDKGLLKDTIVVLTSDEARGIRRTYKGVTRTISQNWGMLVMLLPGGERLRVTEPYAYSDIALSLVDYAGLTDGQLPFIGRSLFRSYPKSRSIPFANINKKRNFLLTGSRDITTCVKGFTKCTHYHRDDDRIFGPGWKKASSASAEDMGHLRRLIKWSSRPRYSQQAVREVTLVDANTGVVELAADNNWGMFLFGGQYLYGDPTQKVVVEIDIEVVSDGGAVRLSSSLSVDHKKAFVTPKVPTLFDGDRLKLRFEYTQPGPLNRVSLETIAKRLIKRRTQLLIHRAVIRMVPLAEGEDDSVGGTVREFSVLYRDKEAGRWRRYDERPRARAHYSVFESPGYRRRACVQQSDRGELRGVGCRRDWAILGPHQPSPSNSRVRARFVVRGTKGEGVLYARLLSGWGKQIHATGTRALITPGREVEITVETTLAEATKAIEGRLGVEPKGKVSVDFELLEGTLDIEPIAQPKPKIQPTPETQPKPGKEHARKSP